MTHMYRVLTEVAIGLFAALVASLIEIHRLREWHHGYYGAAIVAIGAATPIPLWVLVVGLALILDDLVQHAAEAFGVVPPFADFTPIHKLGAWLMAIDWKKQGWWPPVVIVVLLAATAIYSALHWGP